VRGGHRSLLDAERIVERLDKRRQAVSGARCVAHDLRVRVELLVIHAHHLHAHQRINCARKECSEAKRRT